MIIILFSGQRKLLWQESDQQLPGQGGQIEKDTKELSVMVEMFIHLIRMMGMWVYTMYRIHKTVTMCILKKYLSNVSAKIYEKQHIKTSVYQ